MAFVHSLVDSRSYKLWAWCWMARCKCIFHAFIPCVVAMPGDHFIVMWPFYSLTASNLWIIINATHVNVTEEDDGSWETISKYIESISSSTMMMLFVLDSRGRESHMVNKSDFKLIGPNEVFIGQIFGCTISVFIVQFNWSGLSDYSWPLARDPAPHSRTFKKDVG